MFIPKSITYWKIKLFQKIVKKEQTKKKSNRESGIIKIKTKGERVLSAIAELVADRTLLHSFINLEPHFKWTQLSTRLTGGDTNVLLKVKSECINMMTEFSAKRTHFYQVLKYWNKNYQN